MKDNRPDLLFELVKTSFKLKYNDSLLGFIWVLLKPFLQFLILYVVFSQVGRGANIVHYSVYLLLGLVLYSFFQEGVLMGMNSLKDKAHIILKVNFDKSLAILSSISLAALNLVVNLVIVVVFCLFEGVTPNLGSILYFSFVVITLALIIGAFSFLMSILSIKIRDLQHICEIGLQLLFYATPIFYTLDIVPEQFRGILALNPIYIILDTARHAVIFGDIINVDKILLIFIVALVLIFTNFLYFKTQIPKIAEYF